ncbi:MAG: hypothetical protein UT82_C0009G0046 [Parcubacteria group bacterium GW2011_GWB1_40_14]|nr:MAG: hypothetical protein UT82_C0009G0046 [Parcubacteria group bacterium GW2011_GWB1_40_14]
MAINKTTLTGAAGEHFVMFRLLELGYIAGLASRGAPNTDIIVTDMTGRRAVAIQVKTRLPKGSDDGWHMKPKHAELKELNLYYCFVDLPNDYNVVPLVYIVPSEIVAEVIGKIHQFWLSLPGKNGRIHKDSNVRRLLPDYSKVLKVDHPLVKKYSKGWLDQYRENWKILGLN